MENTKIIVVEDENIVALDIRHRLSAMGYDVVATVDTGEKAILKVEIHHPNLILMDIKLKGDLDGIQTAKIIRDRFDLPIIFLTANSDESTLRRAKITEAFGYILKPFEERELATNIEMALYKYKTERKIKENRAYLETIFKSVPDGIFTFDQQGVCMNVNPAGCSILGCSPVEILNLEFGTIFPNEQVDIWGQIKNSEIIVPIKYEYQFNNKRGAETWVELTVAPLEVKDPAGAVGILHDITARKSMEIALHKSEERYMLATKGANDGIWDWDIQNDNLYLSARWKEVLGYSENEIGNGINSWLNLIHPDDLDQVKLNLQVHLQGLATNFQSEHRIRTKRGDFRWFLNRGMAVRDSDGHAYRMVGSQSDITERVMATTQLQHDAFHDTLTGLPNRALFVDRLDRVIERARRSKKFSYAVLFLDLDRFKVVNDSLGHQAGDQLLIEVPQRISKILRASDALARQGGDEFVALLEEAENLEDVIKIAERIQDELKLPFMLSDKPIYISVSIGIVPGSIEYFRAEDILRDADIAMYRAKAAGKARYALFDSDLRESAIHLLELENDLRSAIEHEELQVYYQPILSLDSGKVTGFEALLRWLHPEKGLISPSIFIPLAEESGLILPIGKWAFAEACKQLHLWQTDFPMDPPLTMSVNISSRQFTHPGMVEQVQQVLLENHLNPQSLQLEITENMLMENSNASIATLTRLRQIGVKLLIDDFGIGYSSLSYVQNFPIDTIKIDRTFINEMTEASKRAEIARTIIQLAKKMGLDTIAEGIETPNQLDKLRKLVCNYGQGFLFAKAMAKDEAELFLQTSRPPFHFATGALGKVKDQGASEENTK